MFATLHIIKERNIMKVFLRIKVYAEGMERESSSSKRISIVQNFSDSRKRMTTSNNRYQMSN
jgi:hypothetical protein